MIGSIVGSVVSGVVLNALSPKPDNSAGNAAANASNISANASQQLANISQDQWNYYKQNYQPVEQNLINQAQQANTPEQYAAATGRANADVTNAFDTTSKATANRMQAYGINPASPAYQSTMASSDLAKGSTLAGAETNAWNTQRNLAYSRALDVVGIGRNIPAQSSASMGAASSAAGQAANSAGIAQNSLNSQFNQNNQNMYNVGQSPIYQSLTGAAKSYYTTLSNGNPSPYQAAQNNAAANNAGAGGAGGINSWKDGGKIGYAEGGNVTDENDNILDMRMGDGGKYEAVGLEPALIKKGYHPAMAKMASKGVITPHMRRPLPNPKQRFAIGGGVGAYGIESNQGVLPPSQSNQVLNGPGTETSDSVPAQIDGHQPAALSKGEFVMSAEVPKLSGEEILQAINRAGLEKREQNTGGNPNAGMTAYANGGQVDDWKSQYKRLTGYDADASGIKTPEQADMNIQQMQAMKKVTPINYNQSDSDYGSSGTRNESIYPTTKGYARGGKICNSGLGM